MRNNEKEKINNTIQEEQKRCENKNEEEIKTMGKDVR